MNVVCTKAYHDILYSDKNDCVFVCGKTKSGLEIWNLKKTWTEKKSRKILKIMQTN